MMNERGRLEVDGNFNYWQVLENGPDRSLHIYNQGGNEFASVKCIGGFYREYGDKDFLERLRSADNKTNLPKQVKDNFSNEARKLLYLGNYTLKQDD